MLGLHAGRYLDQVAGWHGDAFGKGARQPHADQFALLAEVRAPLIAVLAGAAADERVEDDPGVGRRRAVVGGLQHGAGAFVAEDHRWHASRIVAMPGVHVGATDADRIDAQQCVAGLQHGFGGVAVLGLAGAGVVKSLHVVVLSNE